MFIWRPIAVGGIPKVSLYDDRLNRVEKWPESCPISIKFMGKWCPMGVETKAAVTVAEMARMLGLSRARFYQLIGSAFPFPVYDVATRRPFYVEEAQKVCLEVRRRNCGIDGKPILFYAKRVPISTKRPSKTSSPKLVVPVEILDGVKSLGINVSTAQVEATIKACFPNGITSIDPSTVVRSVFIHLQQSK